ncbi:MAG: hypothetical protein IJ009_01645 [Clostridia bacterium]|nr:hypothetical protein [Clostridia bacterium]
MKKTIAKLLCLLMVCLLLLPSCSSQTYTVKEIDGNYYLTFPSWDVPITHTTSYQPPATPAFYRTIPEMMQHFSDKNTDIDFTGLRIGAPKTEGKGIHFFDTEHPLVPVLPDGFSEQPESVYWGFSPVGAYDTLIDVDITFYVAEHVLEEDENVKARIYFYHSKLDWTVDAERRITIELLEKEDENTVVSREWSPYVETHQYADGSRNRFYEIRGEKENHIRYVREYTDRDGITSVTMFVLEGEPFFSVQLSGLTESPSVEYLQSFSAKVYED